MIKAFILASILTLSQPPTKAYEYTCSDVRAYAKKFGIKATINLGRLVGMSEDDIEKILARCLGMYKQSA